MKTERKFTRNYCSLQKIESTPSGQNDPQETDSLSVTDENSSWEEAEGNRQDILKHNYETGTSDASAEYVAKVRAMLDNAGIIWQSGELGKVDGGGGTVAMYIANLGVDVVDLGVPVLSMHAPFEVTAKLDVYMCNKAMYEFMK